MPTYVYKFVDTGETIEVQQGFHDENLTVIAHPDSGELLPVKKVFTPVGVTFKGSGFFKTDNRGKKSSTSTSGAKDSKDAGSSSSDAGSSSTSSSSDSTSSSSGTSTSSPSSASPSSGSSSSSDS
jgi:predicted nucleic acid-binding Zn ribbon protein